MTTIQIALLTLYALGMTGGQLLFKTAATGLSLNSAGDVVRLATSPTFLAALLLYSGLSLVWVWLLSFTPLSRAYPFVAISFAVVPLAAWLVFAEPMTVRLVLGVAAIIAGVLLIAG